MKFLRRKTVFSILLHTNLPCLSRTLCCFLLTVLWATLPLGDGSAATPAHHTFSVQIHGVSGAAQKNIKKRVKILTDDLPPDPTEADINHVLSQIPPAVESALNPYGFFGSKLQLSKKRRAAHSHVTVTVTLPPPVLLSHVSLALTGPGAKDPAITQLKNRFPLKANMPFSSAAYEKAKQHLLGGTIQAGFLTARYTKNQVHIDVMTHRATITLHLETGPLFYFGPVTFSQTGLNDTFLRRFLNFKTHERYGTMPLRRLEQILGDTNFFSSISVVPHLPAPSNTQTHWVPIAINLTLNKKKQYALGAGYGTDTGPRGMLGIRLPHLTAYGQHLEALIRASSIQTQMSTTYTLPSITHPATRHYSVDATLIRSKQRLGDSRSFNLSLHHTTAKKGWKQNLTLNALYDQSKNVGQTNKNSNILVYPRIDWLYLVSDHPTQPQYGRRIQLYFQGASQQLLASLNFFQAHLSMKKLHTFHEKVRLLVRGELGFTQVANVNSLPLSFQFYTGGAHSIRGYRYQSLGPGKYLITSSIELQHRLYKRFYITSFFDMGHADNHWMKKLQKGAGVGLMYLSSIGAININVAKAIGRSNPPWVIQFSMGPEL